MEVPREALAEILDEDDERRVVERAAAKKKTAEDARRAAKAENYRITEAELAAVTEAAVAAYEAELVVANFTTPSPREQIFRCETSRQLGERPGYGTRDESEEKAMFDSLRRSKSPPSVWLSEFLFSTWRTMKKAVAAALEDREEVEVVVALITVGPGGRVECQTTRTVGRDGWETTKKSRRCRRRHRRRQ